MKWPSADFTIWQVQKNGCSRLLSISTNPLSPECPNPKSSSSTVSIRFTKLKICSTSAVQHCVSLYISMRLKKPSKHLCLHCQSKYSPLMHINSCTICNLKYLCNLIIIMKTFSSRYWTNKHYYYYYKIKAIKCCKENKTTAPSSVWHNIPFCQPKILVVATFVVFCVHFRYH